MNTHPHNRAARFSMLSACVERVCMALALMLLFVTTALAQKPVNGNGKIVEQMRPLGQFSSVSLNFSADITIVNGETPSFRIEADENVLPHIGTRIRGGELQITQDRWIEPSTAVKIRVGAPFTSEVTTSGYSNLIVEGIKGPRFVVEAGVGTVELYGSADRLQARTKTGTIDASALDAKYADVEISSHGKVRLGSMSKLVAEVSSNGTVIYEGSPEVTDRSRGASRDNIVSADDYREPEQVPVEYVEFVLVNDARRLASLRVEGPPNRSFGYGFVMRPAGARAENWPVGTRIYRTGKLRADKLLLTVKAEMEGERVSLYSQTGN